MARSDVTPGYTLTWQIHDVSLDAPRMTVAQVLSADMARLNRFLAADTAPQATAGGAA